MLKLRTRQGRCLSIRSRLAAVSTGSLMCGALLGAQDLGPTPSHDRLVVPPRDVRHITLAHAQQVAAQVDSLAARLGQLDVEMARELRLAATADYFPKLGTAFASIHFNKFMGEEFTLNRPLRGGPVTVGIPLIGQDQTWIAVTATQPITPLFKVREAVALARADENIARAKAGMAVATRARAVEKNYFDLLVAQKEMALAEATVRNARAGRVLGGTALVPVSAESGVEAKDAQQALQESAGKVRELTASLNELLGWPKDTPLELETPAPLGEMLSLDEAVGSALQVNADVIEAEQNVEKAAAASRLSKLDYVPDVAVTGGYVFQDDVIPALPRDFSYIGVVGSYNLFDFGKREHTMRARSAQLQVARTALELTKAKVAATARASYLELERARAMSDSARGAGRVTSILDVKYRTDDVDAGAGQTQVSLELLRLDLRHREAYTRLKAIMGQP
ncbi:MAG: TolC family protein [Vicinamibacterales bacterium]